MVRLAVILFTLVSAPVLAQSSGSTPRATPAALNLFERDWVLMNWALKHYDSNGNILLEPSEAKAASEEFRRIADANGDGRVTREEYRAAREFILARY